MGSSLTDLKWILLPHNSMAKLLIIDIIQCGEAS